MIAASRLLRTQRALRLRLRAPARRWLATYAESPGQWQSDPCVQMYGQLLLVRETQEDAFLVAAETLRGQTHLPRDLRASAGRARAGVLGRKALKYMEPVYSSPVEAPWPEEAFRAALAAVGRAVEGYAEALAESGDAGLRAEVEKHCPEWADVLAALTRTYKEVLKERGNLWFRKINWYTTQAGHAQVLRRLAMKEGGATADAGSIAAEALSSAGLSTVTEEQPLLEVVVECCERLVADCSVDSEDVGAELRPQRSRAQALLALTHKDLAIAHGLAHDLEASVRHMVAALGCRCEDSTIFTKTSEEQVLAAAQGVMSLCEQEMSGFRHGRAEAAAEWAMSMAKAVQGFKAWRQGS